MTSSMTDQRISIALATYKGERFLREQLDSIAQQSELPDEVVISDDGSPDGTLGVVAEFAATAPFEVRILPPHDRLGFSDNFLHAAESCRYPLIMFCDQDDVWLPEKIAKSRKALLSDDSLIVLHTLTLVDLELKPFGHLANGITQTRTCEALSIDLRSAAYGNTMMFRRELAHLVPRGRRPPSEVGILSHDAWIYALGSSLGRVSQLSESLILYRRGANLSQLDTRTKWQRLVDLGTFNATILEQRADFNRELAAIFADLGELEAAAVYQERADHLDARVSLFAGRSLAERWHLFRALRETRAMPTLKNLVLGVAGLGKRG